MSTLVYPVLVTYEITNISTLASGISAYSSLACVSATDFTEGSRVPGVGEHTSDGTNSGAYVRMNMGLIGGLVAATALAIMM